MVSPDSGEAWLAAIDAAADGSSSDEAPAEANALVHRDVVHYVRRTMFTHLALTEPITRAMATGLGTGGNRLVHFLCEDLQASTDAANHSRHRGEPQPKQRPRPINALFRRIPELAEQVDAVPDEASPNRGKTPLVLLSAIVPRHTMINHSIIELAGNLIRLRADPNYAGAWPLRRAVASGYTEFAAFLFDHGARADIAEHMLHMLAHAGAARTLVELADNHLNYLGEEIRRPVFAVAERRHRMLDLLHRAGFDIPAEVALRSRRLVIEAWAGPNAMTDEAIARHAEEFLARYATTAGAAAQAAGAAGAAAAIACAAPAAAIAAPASAAAAAAAANPTAPATATALAAAIAAPASDAAAAAANIPAAPAASAAQAAAIAAPAFAAAAAAAAIPTVPAAAAAQAAAMPTYQWQWGAARWQLRGDCDVPAMLLNDNVIPLSIAPNLPAIWDDRWSAWVVAPATIHQRPDACWAYCYRRNCYVYFEW